MTLESRIGAGLAEMGIEADGDLPARFAQYLRLIEKWNRVHNLTAIRETDQMVVLHLLDSLSLLPHLEGAATLLDVGTGAGLPGIPLAIARPGLAVTLLDSSQKKAAFLAQAKSELGLANVEVACERVENWHPAGQVFDLVVSRAFSSLAQFVEQAGRLVAPGGRLLAMKGVHPGDELAAVPPSHRIEGVVEVHVPSLDAKRHLVLLKAA